MKILYFYSYFSTPKGSWGTRVYEFASEWVSRGHEVTVVTAIYSKSDLSTNKFIDTQYFNGIKVKVLNIPLDNKKSLLRRLWTFIQYAAVSSWYALTTPADIVIASSGPITVGIPGLIAKYMRGRTLVFEVRDLWPQGMIELGILQNKLLKSIAYWFEARCYKAASLVVALSPGMKSYIEDLHAHPNVVSVTNAANIALFSAAQRLDSTSPFKPRKYAIYTGNIGEVNNSRWLLEAAEELKKQEREDLAIVVIGDGQWREALVAEAKQRKLDNFIHIPLMPKHELIPLLQNALVSLVPLANLPVLSTSSPNKFFESLAAGVPIIQNTDGWMKTFLDKHQVGFTIPSDCAKALCDTIIELDQAEDKRSEMGYRAAEIARENFDKAILAEKMLSALFGTDHQT